ncbi:ParB/RepB/Spo0J family partition protein [Pseudonocardia sp. N23]|uniref:ParB/RepB/Spo0J family partition protein n=1 Tax=Pseudonocardia sp. N23 TaxID=1987376 RepID=UPI000BFB920A|nr:ParB/RepB/Spo0J family partition protein [Pseudonocardia sp. N23]RTL68945.1 MAG: ParB/RepB/Spo0J family partition protein [Pseudonocardiaceae bacterium]
MGKRVDLAALAAEEVPDFAPPARLRLGLQEVPPATVVATSEPGPEVASLGESALPIADIACNPLNRPGADDETDDDEFRELVDTIRTHGVLQPILVCSAEAFTSKYPDHTGSIDGASWVALIGNRRLRAATDAGLPAVPAIVNDDRITSMYEVMLVENGHRKNLSPLDEAQAMSRVLKEERITQKELARRVGRTAMYVSQRLALLGLIPPLRDAFTMGILKLELARQFGTLTEAEQQAIADAGQPYRPQPVNAAAKAGPSIRRISAGTPEQAAESIRKLFTPDELAELLRLLGTRS